MKKTKVVNIFPTMPITRVNPPIRSSVKNVTKSIEEIRTCLMCRAIVEEVTPNGTIRLDNTNYDKDNVACEQNVCELYEKTNISESKLVENEPTESSIWNKAYNDAIASVDLASMTRKQRRAAEASARNAANKVVAEMKNKKNTENDSIDVKEVEIDTDAVESTEDATTEESITIEETPVETMDVENIAEESVE